MDLKPGQTLGSYRITGLVTSADGQPAEGDVDSVSVGCTI
jgi:hypothetical protein